MIDFHLAKLTEKGVYQRSIHKFMVDHPDCKPKPGRALGFNNMASAFLIYFLGFGGSIFLLIGEAVFKKFNAIKRHDKKAKEDDILNFKDKQSVSDKGSMH